MSDQNITIYGAEWCAFCHTAKQYLDKKNISYKYIDVDNDSAAGMEAVEKSGQRGIPVIDIGGDIIVGFDLPKINSALDSHKITA
ncbi:MAG: hypothetical protein NVS1B10_06820 [Candidatus Saccharimonadales bacterium]